MIRVIDRLKVIERFVNPEICTGIINLCKTGEQERFKPSTVTNDGKKRNKDKSRFSLTANFQFGENTIIDIINISIAKYTNTRLNDQEPMQIQYYPNGGFYRQHYDAFKNLQSGEKNRQSTFMIYLNTVKNGGRTIFPRINMAIEPKAGTAVYWHNLNADGSINENSLHESELTQEPKWIMTKWIRRA